MKKYIIIILGLGLTLSLGNCEFENDVDPNQPSLSAVLANTSPQELNLLVGGLEARSRDAMGAFITATGSIARELYDFNASDPTTTETLIGKDGATLNGSEPQLTGTMFARYQAVKSAEFILEAVENVALTEAQKQGFRGVANTFKGLNLMNVLSLLNNNGVRVDVKDPENLGPYLSKAEGFQAIRGFLDLGFDQLQGAEFTFQLSGGFTGFDTPAEFAGFNRAIAARVALYEEDYASALSLVNSSFMDMNGELADGPKKSYGVGGTEILNPIFKSPQQSGDQYVVHNRLITDIQAGDARINKFRLRDDPVPRDGLNGTHEIDLYASSTSPIDFIRNEELILIFAEASVQVGNLSDAVDALNVIRNAYGLANYGGAVTEDALIDELLYNRGYSLWAEGHAMFDLRRYDRLNDQFLPIDRTGDIIHTEFPIPPFEQ
ncbi:MAG: RagB/SusD family nutrient uptake outer membrane protein [Cyclobacteriaceae bacterium]|nr:RagB/SusD family nutrient uptake outer membrane protein [Cyclobacteriaceae bacterium]